MGDIKRYLRADANGEYVLHSDHEAEVARLRVMAQEQGVKDGNEITRLRAELNAATKAGLDAIATICEKEREADALRVDAERYRFLRSGGCDATLRFHNTNAAHRDDVIDAAMGEGK